MVDDVYTIISDSLKRLEDAYHNAVNGIAPTGRYQVGSVATSRDGTHRDQRRDTQITGVPQDDGDAREVVDGTRLSDLVVEK